MSKLISAVTTKGGSGKSTLALTLAHAKAFREMRVAVVEADPQGSLSGWAEERRQAGKPSTVPVHALHDPAQLVDKSGEMARDLAEIVNGHDLTIMDCPGESRAQTRTLFALAFSDLVLIPIRASEFDFQSVAQHILPLIEKVSENGMLYTRYFLVPTMTHHLAGLEKTVASLEGTKAEVLRATLPFRKVYTEFAEGGGTLEEYSRKPGPRIHRKQAKKAMGEIDRIAGEVAGILGLQ